MISIDVIALPGENQFGGGVIDVNNGLTKNGNLVDATGDIVIKV